MARRQVRDRFTLLEWLSDPDSTQCEYYSYVIGEGVMLFDLYHYPRLSQEQHMVKHVAQLVRAGARMKPLLLYLTQEKKDGVCTYLATKAGAFIDYINLRSDAPDAIMPLWERLNDVAFPRSLVK